MINENDRRVRHVVPHVPFLAVRLSGSILTRVRQYLYTPNEPPYSFSTGFTTGNPGYLTAINNIYSRERVKVNSYLVPFSSFRN
jgi:hypothetical protein